MSSKTMTIKMTRKDLLAKLTSQLAKAETEDLRLAGKYSRELHHRLGTWRSQLRQAQCWSVEKVLAKHKDDSSFLRFDAPACPELPSKDIRKVLDSVKLDTGAKTYSFSPETLSFIYRALSWVPESKQAPGNVCQLLKRRRGRR